MKKILTLLFLFFAVVIGFAQAPNMINYQGIARNSVGNVLANQAISVKLSIRDLTATGAVVYTEIRNVTTNFYGLFSFGIGSPGATGVTGTIAGVNWATGAKFLQVEIDPAGGSSFTNVGTTQLLSVPYALFSNSANAAGPAGGDLSGTYPNPTVARIRGVNVLATAPLNRQVLKFNGTDWVPARDSLTLPFNVNDTNLTSFIINNTRLTGQTVVISAIMRTTTNVSAAISGIDGSSGAVSPVDSKTFGVIGITGNTGIGVGGYAINGTALRGAVSGTGLALHTTGAIRLAGISEGLGRVLTSDASGNATWQALGGVGGVSGSGTLNYVPKWTPDGTTLGNSLIFDNGTNIGIGTITPSYILDVAGVSRITDAVGQDQALIIKSLGANGNRISFTNPSDTRLATVGLNPTNSQLLINNAQDPGASTTLYPVVLHTGSVRVNLQSNNGLLFIGNNVDRFIIKPDGKVGIGTITPDASSILDISSTSSGVLIPRMTSAQRDAIATPATSLMIYQTDNTPAYYYYNGSVWVQLATGSSASNYWSLNGTDIYNNNSGNVGIGTTTPSQKLDVVGNGLITGSLTVSSGVSSSQSSGTALYGTSSSGYGVYATSGYTGVYGSGNSYGVYGYSPNNYGVFGSSGYTGVYGNGNSYGVYGFSTSNYGVYGTSSNGVGVYGYSDNLKAGYFYSVNENGLWAKTGRGDKNYAGVFEGNVYTFNSYQTSDKNLKKNIEDVGDAISIIKRLKPKTYEFRHDGKLANLKLPEGRHYGILAQDLEEVLPNLVREVENEVSVPTKMNPIAASSSTPDGNVSATQKPQMETAEKITIKAVNYTELIPVMIKAIQEQQITIEQQKEKITALEAKLTRLESILATISKK